MAGLGQKFRANIVGIPWKPGLPSANSAQTHHCFLLSNDGGGHICCLVLRSQICRCRCHGDTASALLRLLSAGQYFHLLKHINCEWYAVNHCYKSLS